MQLVAPALGDRCADGGGAEVTVNDVLNNSVLQEANAKYQRYIDWNRGVLIASWFPLSTGTLSGSSH